MLTKQEFIKQLKELVAVESLSGDLTQNAKVLDVIETMVDSKATIKRIKNKTAEILLVSNRTNATNEQLMNPDFGYLVHVDVVAASDMRLWDMQVVEREVISPQDKENGKKATLQAVALGRGVSDMKFSVPIGISILNDLIKSNSKKTITLAITTDEERGGFDGALFLADALKFRPKIMIVPDGGDNWNFVYRAKGIVHIKITCTGRAAHGSRPWKGDNAISKINKILSKLLDKYEKNSMEYNWETTMNPGVIKGGVSVNQVCDLVTLDLDFRFPETNTKEAILKEVASIASEVGADISTEILSQGLPTLTDQKSEVVKDFIATMQKNCSSKILLSETVGGSDARHFTQYNIPILMMKPLGGDIHENSEWISVDSCLEYEQGLMEFILKERK